VPEERQPAEKQTTFTTPELVQAVAGSLPVGGTADEVLELAEKPARSPGVELVEHGDTPGRPARFTTRELLAVEREAVELALAGRNVAVPQPERRALAEALMLTGNDLTGEQRMLGHEAATRPDRVVCVVGVAGSGKTLALRALADAYRGIDVTVLGAAPSGRAADELQNATGIPSRTLHRLLLDAQRDEALPSRCVLVVDEAGMAETRVLAPLLRAVDRAEGKLLLIGDPAQLPAVGAGGLYQALCDRLDALELAGNRRQRDPLEREALARLRAGEPERYLAHAALHGRVAVDDNPTMVKERPLADWWREARRSPARSVILACHRRDVDELNQAAHALMLDQGAAPFQRETGAAAMWAHLQAEPPRLRDLPALDPVLASGLAKEKVQRYGSCGELVEAATHAFGGAAPAAVEPTEPPRPADDLRLSGRRRRGS
jgi:hypothetical protein